MLMLNEYNQINIEGKIGKSSKSWWGAKASIFSAFAPVC